MDEMTQKILSIVEDVSGLDNIGGDTDLFADGILDSMATVEVLVTLQDTFGIQVPVSEFDRSEWSTVNKIAEQVKLLEN